LPRSAELIAGFPTRSLVRSFTRLFQSVAAATALASALRAFDAEPALRNLRVLSKDIDVFAAWAKVRHRPDVAVD
jgi:hypothetical protein